MDCDLSVDCNQPFDRSLPLFGISQKFFAVSVLTVAFRLTAFSGLTYFFEKAFSQIKVIKIPKPSGRSMCKILPSLVSK